jgi:hypothetical protein
LLWVISLSQYLQTLHRKDLSVEQLSIAEKPLSVPNTGRIAAGDKGRCCRDKEKNAESLGLMMTTYPRLFTKNRLSEPAKITAYRYTGWKDIIPRTPPKIRTIASSGGVMASSKIICRNLLKVCHYDLKTPMGVVISRQRAMMISSLIDVLSMITAITWVAMGETQRWLKMVLPASASGFRYADDPRFDDAPARR